MTRARRHLRWIALVVAGCLAATGCERSSETIVNPDMVWAIGASDAGDTGLAQAIAALWNSQKRRSTVRVHALPGQADDQRQLMATELNAELSNLDILTLDVTQTGEFAVNGWLADLQAQRHRIKELSLPAPVQSASWGGRLWAAPFISEAAFLYYRKDLVSKAPATWTELDEVGQRAALRAGLAPLVGQGRQYEGLVVNYLEYLAGAGGALFNRDGTEVSFDEDPARSALEWMHTAKQDGLYAKDFEQMDEKVARDRFMSGQAVFMRNWPDAYALMNTSKESMVEGQFEIAPLPTFDGKGSSAITGGSNLGVSRFSQYPSEARAFVLWASTNAEVQHLLAKRYSRGPALASVYDDPDLKDDPVMKLLGNVLKDAQARPPTPDWSTISDEIQQAIYPAYTSAGTADLTLPVRKIRAFLELTTSTRR